MKNGQENNQEKKYHQRPTHPETNSENEQNNRKNTTKDQSHKNEWRKRKGEPQPTKKRHQKLTRTTVTETHAGTNKESPKNKSTPFLKLSIVDASATRAGSLFHFDTHLTANILLLNSDLQVGTTSLSLCPLVLSYLDLSNT